MSSQISPLGLPSLAVCESDFLASAFRTLSTARRVGGGTATGRAPCTTHASATAIASESGYVVVSLIDNRAGEIGLAAMDTNRGSIELMQYGDDASQSKTLMQLTVLHPVEILLPHTSLQSRLAQTIARHFSQSANITAVHRREYNESKGAHRLTQLMSTAIPQHQDGTTGVMFSQPCPVSGGGIPCSASTEILHTDHYLCMAASHALLSFVESTNGVLWIAGTVRVRYKALEGLVQLDRGTAKGLRIIASVAPHSQSRRGAAPVAGSTSAVDNGAASLAEALDFTLTLGGRRLLRRNVLQPLRDLPAICLRQDTVAFLLTHRNAFVAFRNQLRRIASPLDLDSVVSAFASVPSSAATRASTSYTQRCVSNLVSLRQVIVVVESIVEELRRFSVSTDCTTNGNPHWKRARCDEDENATQHDDCVGSENRYVSPTATAHTVPKLLRSILDTLEASSLEPLRRHLDTHLDEDIISGRALLMGAPNGTSGIELCAADEGEEVSRQPKSRRGGGGSKNPQGVALQVQQCFAIRPTVSSALDVARETYAELMESVFQHVDTLRDSHRVPSLKLRFDHQRQLFLSYDAQHDHLALANVFLRKHHPKKGRSITCTTHELTALKASIIEVLEEIASAQRHVVGKLTDHVREAMPTLQAVCDAVSLLDMLVSFTSFSIANRGVRPELVAHGPLISQNCGLVHLVNVGMNLAGIVPTPICLSSEQPVVILGGPNASGKSTLLRAVGHASIVAHIGCFVPVVSVAPGNRTADGAQATTYLAEPRPVFRMLDRLIALVPERDDALGAANGIMESSFFHEMRSVAFATQVITRSSLVLIDEVGRGTSTSEGTCVARALIEWLADVRCLAIVATHLVGLVKIPQLISGVQNQHMAVVVKGMGKHNVGVETSTAGVVANQKTLAIRRSLYFTFAPVPGPCTVDQYGIRLAEQIGVAPALLRHVPRILRVILVPMPSTATIGNSYGDHVSSFSSLFATFLSAVENHPNFVSRDRHCRAAVVHHLTALMNDLTAANGRSTSAAISGLITDGLGVILSTLEPSSQFQFGAAATPLGIREHGASQTPNRQCSRTLQKPVIGVSPVFSTPSRSPWM